MVTRGEKKVSWREFALDENAFEARRRQLFLMAKLAINRHSGGGGGGKNHASFPFLQSVRPSVCPFVGAADRKNEQLGRQSAEASTP